MFPEPQSVLPLPPSPHAEWYKKRAKALTAACRSAEPNAFEHWAASYIDALIARVGLVIPTGMPVDRHEWIDGLASFAQRELHGDGTSKGACRLTSAQFAIARSHGFRSWPAFVAQLDALANAGSDTTRFETAADAIVAGDVARLRELLRDDPKLVRARSSREHGGTLLHYVAANGHEGYRQKTPPNIVEIAELLIDSGAEVDARMRVYGSDCTTLGLVATSTHPQRAGVQEALMALLLDRGAALDVRGGAGRSHTLVEACYANGQPGAAAFLIARGAPVT